MEKNDKAAAFFVNENSNARKEMTLGSHINIEDGLNKEEYRDDKSKFTILKSQLFMYEYGYYLQRQELFSCHSGLYAYTPDGDSHEISCPDTLIRAG